MISVLHDFRWLNAVFLQVSQNRHLLGERHVTVVIKRTHEKVH